MDYNCNSMKICKPQEDNFRDWKHESYSIYRSTSFMCVMMTMDLLQILLNTAPTVADTERIISPLDYLFQTLIKSRILYPTNKVES